MKLLGLDSGGSKTEAVIFNSKFEPLGVGRSGPGNYHRVGKEKALENIKNSIKNALSSTGINKRIDWGVFGIGGLDTDRDYEIVSNLLDDLEYCRERSIVNDVVLSYYSTTAGEPGISVVAGTGSIAYGVNENGRKARVGGWGWRIDDEGSGYYISVKALNAATKAFDGRGEETKLLEAAKNFFELDEFEEIVKIVYGNESDNNRKIASFAESVVESGLEGDPVALEIVEDAAEELAGLVLALKDKLGMENGFIVGCTGCVFSSDLIYKKFEKKVRERIPEVEIGSPIKNPVVGAIALGAEKIGKEISKEKIRFLDKKLVR